MQAGFKAEVPLGYVQFAAGSIDAATALSPPAGTSLIWIQCEAQAVRWRDDGTNPTAAVGQPLAVGVMLAYTGQKMAQLKFISQVAGAILNCTYYGQGA
jgi:hypothetical protein